MVAVPCNASYYVIHTNNIRAMIVRSKNMHPMMNVRPSLPAETYFRKSSILRSKLCVLIHWPILQRRVDVHLFNLDATQRLSEGQ